MSGSDHEAYEFGGFRMDPVRRVMSGPDGKPIRIKAKAFDTLLYLVEHAGELCGKRELMAAVWPGLVVEENNLNQNISALRRALGERPGEHRFIVTEPGRGYRFVMPVSSEQATDTHLERDVAIETLPIALAPSPRTRRLSRSGRALALVTATAVVTSVVGTLVAWRLWTVAQPRPVNRFYYVLPKGQAFRFWGRPAMALSPDGRRFVYNAAGGLYLRSMDDLEAQPIPGTEQDLTDPFFSPDGQSVAYWAGKGGFGSGPLKRIAISGGTAVVIADGIGNPLGASWGADGTILFAEPAGIFRVSANGSGPELVVPAKGGEMLDGPELLPDGDSVLFSATTTGNWDDAQIVAQSLSTGKRTVLVKGGSDAHYVQGRLVYALGDGLFGIAFDPKSLTISGGAVPLVQGVMRAYSSLTAAANYGVSKDGTLVYARGTQTVAANQLVWVDTEGDETPVPTPPRAYVQVVLSPDGMHAAVTIGDKSVWIADLERGTLERLPADLGEQDPAILFFSTDGRRIASSALRDGRRAVVWQQVDGRGTAEPLVTFDASVTRVEHGPLSPDGKQFVTIVVRKNKDLGMVMVGDPKSYRNFLATAANESFSAISPDGRWIAYNSDVTGTPQVYVQRFPEGGGRLAVSINGGAYPHWSADGGALTYMQLDEHANPVSIARVPVTGLEGPKAVPRFGAPKKLFPWKYLSRSDGDSHFDMTADGKRFLMIAVGPQSTGTTRFVVVTNWVQELKRLVPIK